METVMFSFASLILTTCPGPGSAGGRVPEGGWSIIYATQCDQKKKKQKKQSHEFWYMASIYNSHPHNIFITTEKFHMLHPSHHPQPLFRFLSL